MNCKAFVASIGRVVACWRRHATRLALSARGVHRVLRVARTIADLDTAGSAESSDLALTHLAEALQLRLADRV